MDAALGHIGKTFGLAISSITAARQMTGGVASQRSNLQKAFLPAIAQAPVEGGGNQSAMIIATPFFFFARSKNISVGRWRGMLKIYDGCDRD